MTSTAAPGNACRIACICSLLICLLMIACAAFRVPDTDAIRSAWVGKPMADLIETLGSPHHTTPHPDGEIQYIYQFRSQPVYEDIFRGEFLNDMSTIRIQEELAREDRFRCTLEVFARQDRIVRMALSGNSCTQIRMKLAGN